MQRKVPLPGKIFARCIPKRLFAGLFGCMARISCQSQLISDAWCANLATNWRFSRPRPLSGCMERKTCHGLPPGNASRHNLATTGRPRRTPRAPMCHGSRSAHALWLRTPPVVYATRHPDAAELRVLQAVRALAVAQPADCRVAAERVVNIAKLVSVPQRRSARHHAPRRHALRCHAPQRHNAMRCNIATPCATMPCTVRGAFVAAEKVSCGLRVSMR